MLEEERGGRKPLREEPDTEKEGLATPFNMRDFFYYYYFVLFSASLQQNSSFRSKCHSHYPIYFLFGPGYHCKSSLKSG